MNKIHRDADLEFYEEPKTSKDKCPECLREMNKLQDKFICNKCGIIIEVKK